MVCGRKWYGRYEYKRILRQRVQIRGIFFFFFLGGGGGAVLVVTGVTTSSTEPYDFMKIILTVFKIQSIAA